MRKICFLVLLLVGFSSFSQSYNYAIYCKDTLTSPFMAGRAYQDQGDRRAADFIRGELTKNKVELLGDNGFQPVEICVNNIKDAFLTLGKEKKTLQLGEEFLVAGFSPSCNVELNNVKPFVFSTKASLDKIKREKLASKTLVFNIGELSYYDIVVFLRKLSAEGINPQLAIVQGYDKIQYSIGRNSWKFPLLQLSGKPIGKRIDYLALSIEADFQPHYQSQNVWARVEGTKYPDSTFVFVSHYDHLGKIGQTYFPGANDNASGVSVLLDLAKYYASNPAECSIVFIFVTGEEIGLVGSTVAAENPLINLQKVKFLFNLDMVGTGSTGVAVINGQKERRAGELLQEINSENHWFSKVVLGEESCNSDHCPFVQKGVAAHFLFTYGCEYNEYHSVHDNGKELSFTKHIDFCNLLKEFVRRYK